MTRRFYIKVPRGVVQFTNHFSSKLYYGRVSKEGSVLHLREMNFGNSLTRGGLLMLFREAFKKKLNIRNSADDVARYETILKAILKSEGGYCFNANDSGGETFMGISRKFNPGISLWTYIDAYFDRIGIKEPADKHQKRKLVDAVCSDEILKNCGGEIVDVYVNYFPLYNQNLWMKINKLNEEDKFIVLSMLYFFSVNAGLNRATSILTSISEVTVQTIKDKIRDYYNDLCIKKPKNKVFLNGWLSRLEKSSRYNYIDNRYY